MDTEHDQDALLRRVDRDVVETLGDFGVFQVQFLEGPTDNPIRVLAPGGTKYREQYDFAIEGAGWLILCDILGLPGRRGDRSTTPYYLSCFIAVVRKFPRSFDLLNDPVQVPFD
jgi:hypothetical protein